MRCAGHWLQNSWFSTVLATAARSMLDVRIVRSHIFELRDSSFIMPSDLPHIAHCAMSPTASSDSRFAFAHYVQSEAAPALPMQQWCGVQPPMQRVMLRSLVSVGGEGTAAQCCGHREPPYTHRSRFACSMRVPLRRWGGVGFSDICKLDSLMHVRCGHGVNMYVGTPEHQFFHSYVLSYYLNSVTSQ